MANEATLLFETAHPIPFTCADGTGIEKGAVLILSDPMTAAVTTLSGSAAAGFAAAEKIANSGTTKVPVFREGIFKVTLSGSCTAGDALINWGGVFALPDVNIENIWGTALETGVNGETIKFELKPVVMNLA